MVEDQSDEELAWLRKKVNDLSNENGRLRLSADEAIERENRAEAKLIMLRNLVVRFDPALARVIGLTDG